jgi:glutaredoxin
MPTICAKCQLVRPESTDAPVWQCPGCGVAYNKAADARGATSPVVQRPRRAEVASNGDGIPWGKWLLALILIGGAYAGYQAVQKRGWTGGEGVTSIATRLKGGSSAEQLAALAASSKPGDVFMYTADWCPNCRAAKGWMAQYGFKYEQCDIDKDHGCKSKLDSLGGDGIPYLIVKGHHMRDGFDSEGFVAALQAK